MLIPTSLQHSAFIIRHCVVVAMAVANAAAATTTLQSVGGLPAHIAGRFAELTLCRQRADGTFIVFDRRSHTVFSVAPGADEPREIVQIGAEPGRILRPYAFDLAADGSFVVADAPGGRGRVQFFVASGSRLGGFALPGREVPLVTFDGLVLSGLGSLVYNGRSIFVSRPESGSLVTELGADAVSARTFGELRTTGHEQERDLHLALNSGLVVINPEGGFYFVFVAGVPTFRKYDAAGALMFERHIEGDRARRVHAEPPDDVAEAKDGGRRDAGRAAHRPRCGGRREWQPVGISGRALHLRLRPHREKSSASCSSEPPACWPRPTCRSHRRVACSRHPGAFCSTLASRRTARTPEPREELLLERTPSSKIRACVSRASCRQSRPPAIGRVSFLLAGARRPRRNPWPRAPVAVRRRARPAGTAW